MVGLYRLTPKWGNFQIDSRSLIWLFLSIIWWSTILAVVAGLRCRGGLLRLCRCFSLKVWHLGCWAFYLTKGNSEFQNFTFYRMSVPCSRNICECHCEHCFACFALFSPNCSDFLACKRVGVFTLWQYKTHPVSLQCFWEFISKSCTSQLRQLVMWFWSLWAALVRSGGVYISCGVRSVFMDPFLIETALIWRAWASQKNLFDSRLHFEGCDVLVEETKHEILLLIFAIVATLMTLCLLSGLNYRFCWVVFKFRSKFSLFSALSKMLLERTQFHESHPKEFDLTCS